MCKVKIGTVITLTDVEQSICYCVAPQRTNCARKNRVTDQRIDNNGKKDIDLEGFAAELCFCRLFNLYPDFTVGVRSSANNTDCGDAVLVNENVVDVKSTEYPFGRLLAVPAKKNSGNVELYGLMTGKFPTFTFRGFMWPEELFKPFRYGTLNGTDYGYIGQQHELAENFLLCPMCQHLSHPEDFQTVLHPVHPRLTYNEQKELCRAE